MNTQVTTTQFGQKLWVPFNLSQTILDPGSCTPLGILELSLGQRAKLAWLSLHYIRLLASFAPNKLNPSFGGVYVALYGSQGALIQLVPGQPLCYVGLDVPSVTQLSPAFAPELREPDTYNVLVVNNMMNAQAEVSVSGTWQVSLS